MGGTVRKYRWTPKRSERDLGRNILVDNGEISPLYLISLKGLIL
jgi:hypothetical protein